MTIQEVYDEYHIMPNLQLHMYRVAGVARIICQARPDAKTQQHDIVSACLLHDMGNIIKFDLSYFLESVEPLGLEYWQGVQTQYIEKYGNNEVEATFKIAQELQVSDRVLELIDAVGFLQAEQNYKTQDMARKVCDYADTRVTPTGVVSLEERFVDLEKRYGAKFNTQSDTQKREEYRQLLRLIEQQIFDSETRQKLEPTHITEEKVSLLFPLLREFELSS